MRRAVLTAGRNARTGSSGTAGDFGETGKRENGSISARIAENRRDDDGMDIFKLISKTLGAMRQEFGADAKLENGDQLVSVFKDATFIMRDENGELKVELIIGKPYIFEEAVFDEEESVDEY